MRIAKSLHQTLIACEDMFEGIIVVFRMRQLELVNGKDEWDSAGWTSGVRAGWRTERRSKLRFTTDGRVHI